MRKSQGGFYRDYLQNVTSFSMQTNLAPHSNRGIVFPKRDKYDADGGTQLRLATASPFNI